MTEVCRVAITHCYTHTNAIEVVWCSGCCLSISRFSTGHPNKPAGRNVIRIILNSTHYMACHPCCSELCT